MRRGGWLFPAARVTHAHRSPDILHLGQGDIASDQRVAGTRLCLPRAMWNISASCSWTWESFLLLLAFVPDLDETVSEGRDEVTSFPLASS